MSRKTSRLPLLQSLVTVGLVMGGAACVESQDSNTGGSGLQLDRAAFIEDLKKSGHTVETKGTVVQPFLSIQGQFVSIDGADVQTFEYASESAAKAEAAKISPDGSTVGNTRIGWVEPPHFFRKGKLLVLYAGKNQNVTQILTALLGPQSAGE